MPNFTDDRIDRAYESFDAVDVHFACRLNEIGCPASTGTLLKPRSSSRTWRGISGKEQAMGILYKAETEDISDKPDLNKDSEICHRPIILENRSINERYKSELKTILRSVDYVEAESAVIKIKYKQKDNRYTRVCSH